MSKHGRESKKPKFLLVSFHEHHGRFHMAFFFVPSFYPDILSFLHFQVYWFFFLFFFVIPLFFCISLSRVLSSCSRWCRSWSVVGFGRETTFEWLALFGHHDTTGVADGNRPRLRKDQPQTECARQPWWRNRFVSQDDDINDYNDDGQRKITTTIARITYKENSTTRL